MAVLGLGHAVFWAFPIFVASYIPVMGGAVGTLFRRKRDSQQALGSLSGWLQMSEDLNLALKPIEYRFRLRVVGSVRPLGRTHLDHLSDFPGPAQSFLYDQVRWRRNMIEGMRLEGLSLTVEDVERSLAFYRDRLKLEVVYASPPAFALLRLGAVSIGLLSGAEAAKEGVAPSSPEQRRGVHIEFTTDDLDGLYDTLRASGVEFLEPPHEEPWERAMTALDPDGHSVEFAQGRRGDRL